MNKIITLTAALATISAFTVPVYAQGANTPGTTDSTTDAGNPPSGESNDSTTDAGNPPSGSPENDANGSTTTDGQTTTPTDLADPAVNNPAEASSTPTTDGSMTMEAPEGFTAQTTGTPILASSLQNANIYTTSGQVVGAASQIVSGADGSASQIIFDVGQYMGADTKIVAVPVTDVQVYTSADNSEYRIILPMSEAEIQALPPYAN